MSANVETAVYANTPAWHREGIVLDTGNEKGLTVETALVESGLDWEVRKVPIFAASAYVEEDGKFVKAPNASLGNKITRRYGVQRDSDGKMLGVVGGSWQPVQNHEGFEVLREFMQGSDAWIEAAGALDGGRKVWMLAHMPEDLVIAGEKVSSYVLFTNGHDGRTAVTAAMTDVRVVCQNTLTFALNLEDKANKETKGAGRVVRVRHSANASQRLAEAKHILGIRNLYAEELARQGEWLVEQEMSDAEFEVFLSALMPIKEDQKGKPADTMISKRREQVTDLYMTAPNLKPVRGTKWGALNAVVEYADYGRNFKDGNTQLKAQFNDTKIKDSALGLLKLGPRQLKKVATEAAAA